jgi:hypothetical protein
MRKPRRENPPINMREYWDSKLVRNRQRDEAALFDACLVIR